MNLLSPVQKAAEQSAFVRELVDSGRIFKPLPWAPAEAYRFLKDVPMCEDAGVIVRLPDWWKGGRPPRPQVSVRVGQARGAGLGADTLLDFSVETTLDGEPLTDAEWQSLLQAADGLALVRGQWIEVDPEKLRAALAHWRKVETMARRDGLSFFEGMRLDESPDLLFTLRSVNAEELIAQAATASDLLTGKAAAGPELAEDELSAVFGLELDTASGAPPASPPPTPKPVGRSQKGGEKAPTATPRKVRKPVAAKTRTKRKRLRNRRRPTRTPAA